MKGKNSIRVKMNEICKKHVSLKDISLDLGSIGSSSYLRFINNSGILFFVDKYKSSNVSILADLENNLPFKRKSVNNILLFNVIEHIFNEKQLLMNIRYVLKDKGNLFIIVPFLVMYHPSPHDYTRFTHEKLIKLLSDVGFKTKKLIIVGGFFNMINYNMFYLMPSSLGKIKFIIHFVLSKSADLLDSFLKRKIKNYNKMFPLFYFIIAEK